MKIRFLNEKLDENTGLKIKYATLLSIDEVKKLPFRLREYNNWWWLKSPGYYQGYAACVSSVGSVLCRGDGVGGDVGCVRPALNISNLDSTNFEIGDTFKFGGKKFEIISENMAFCLEDIGKCVFREDYKADDANDYEKSDVKNFVDNWFNNSK